MLNVTTAPTARCRPWCTDHVNGTPAPSAPSPDDQLCLHRIASPAYGEILTTHSVDDGTLITLHRTRDDLTPAQAEQLAYALLAQVAATRTAVAA